MYILATFLFLKRVFLKSAENNGRTQRSRFRADRDMQIYSLTAKRYPAEKSR